MTIATLLDYMEIFDNELETGSGDVDESRSITALNMAQDLWEQVCASQPSGFLQTYSTTTTTASQEYTTWPTDLLRLDSLWLIDTNASPNRPSRKIDLIDEPGGHIADDGTSVLNLTASTQSGAPREYAVTKRSRFLWRPLPDAVYTVRYYGFIRASDYTARANTFAYDDAVALPLSALAVKFLSIGVGDDTGELQAAAEESFTPVIKAIQKATRVKPPSRFYSRVHTT